MNNLSLGMLTFLRRIKQYMVQKRNRLLWNRNKLHRYWQSPEETTGKINTPEHYIGEQAHARSVFLVDLMQRYTRPESHILEIGCNAGRNLNFLFEAGYHHLEAIEINQQAVNLLRQTFPTMVPYLTVHIGSVEEEIRRIADARFDVVFTMAVLEHIHSNSEWMFTDMVRVTCDIIITIEDEKTTSWRHFPRNYQVILNRWGCNRLKLLPR